MSQGYKSLEAIKYLVCFNYITMVIFLFRAVITMPHKTENGLNLSLHILQYGVCIYCGHLVFNFKHISNLIITPPNSVILYNEILLSTLKGKGDLTAPFLWSFMFIGM